MENKNEGLKLIVCFSDKNEAKKPITLENPSEEYLKDLNEKGYGIFETANSFYATKEQLLSTGYKTKRHKEFVTCLNEVFADLDICKDSDGMPEEEREARKKDLKEALNKYCPPSVYVITKNGLQPRWWLSEPNVDGETQQRYENVTNGIIEWSKKNGAKGDPVKDVTRVLRKPGYYHHKSEPYLITEEKGSGKTQTLNDLKKYFWNEEFIKPISTEKEGNSTYSEIDSIDIRTVAIDVWKEKGSEASFDKDDHLIVDGKITATFKGRLGGNYIATSSSDYPANGNAVTYVAKTLGINNKEAYKWICRKYNIETHKSKGVTIETIEEMLKTIPSDIAPVKLLEVLEPIFKKLISIEKITAETFILSNIKEYFGLTKEDAKKYITHANLLRLKLAKEIKRVKSEEKRLPLILDRDIDFQEAIDTISEIGIINEQTLKIVIAVIISAKLRLNPPLWLFLIGVPSSLKTELVGFFEWIIEAVYTLDTHTENAFASGYVPSDGSETQDLLPLLDNKAFIIKDLNTLFSMNEEMVKKILGDLTSIFDGKFQKFTATRGMIDYRSLFSMIGCVTPAILNKHYNYATQLGPRFFFLRLPELTEEETQKSLDKFWNEKDRKGKIIKTRQIISSYCTQLLGKIDKYQPLPESKEIQKIINNIARFICQARGIAITAKASFKNEKGDNVDYYEIKDWQVEQPWRILNQLKSLLRILSFINNKTAVTSEEIKIIKPIILSTMPVDRAEILSILTVECGLSKKQLSGKIGKSTKTIGRTMKELEALKLVDSYKDPKFNFSGQAPKLFFLVEEFASVLGAPTPSQEFMSISKNNSEEVDSDYDDDETL
jgi:hypothetical protein